MTLELSAKQLSSLRMRLPQKINVRGPDECWEWTAKPRTAFGYGRINAGRGVNLKAHRAAYLAWVGPIPESMYLLHRCDNPSCCNPAHLFVGTPLDNMRDMAAKGRLVARGPAKNPRRPDCNMATGARNGNSAENRALRQSAR